MIIIIAIIITVVTSDSGQCAVMVSSSPGSLQGPIGEITTTKLDVREMFSPTVLQCCEIFSAVVVLCEIFSVVVQVLCHCNYVHEMF